MPSRYRLLEHRRAEPKLRTHVHLPDRSAANDAAELIALFGDQAASEAEARAALSRDRGNVIHFCRWRQIGRMVELLSSGPGEAALH
ncbi:hypothetical protein [Sphingosinicella sp. CPCC 101087]|uniref:hypothetical protein n=1 Tax=Sphingosinicella sp. CPCC 101087 TaxID=2497754 RepID=UPI00352A05EF